MNRPLLTALLAGLLAAGGPALSEETQPQTTKAVAVSSININTAGHEQLAMLSGVGPAKAAAIVQYRENNGPFTSVDDLSKVKGIGTATVEKNRHLLSH
ncbi:ComEA family DNA-binding protein [Zobellella maritima]|uniref:ComEA family DNA-binding protein n=1 Tax=Zobellella maritima TaxID=2059725 RepID=UPI000E304EB3|nr:ComEA family DNA-binding protein [Zobellella maritima]